MVVHGANVPPWLLVLSATLNVTSSGSVCAASCTPSVVEKPANPGLPPPGFDSPRAKKYVPVVVPGCPLVHPGFVTEYTVDGYVELLLAGIV
jgi:hypothetical protein